MLGTIEGSCLAWSTQGKFGENQTSVGNLHANDIVLILCESTYKDFSVVISKHGLCEVGNKYVKIC